MSSSSMKVVNATKSWVIAVTGSVQVHVGASGSPYFIVEIAPLPFY